MRKPETHSYSYEVKVSVTFDNLESTNAFLNDILSRFNQIGVTNVNVNMTRVIDKDTELKVEQPVELPESHLIPEKKGRISRRRPTQTAQDMKNLIKKYIEEKGSATRKDLLDLTRQHFGDRYKETTVVQKTDIIVKALLESGEIRRKTRGIFVSGEVTETETQ